MDFKTAVRTCFAKYVTFSGRASRSEYWWFALFIFLGSIAFGLIDGVLFGTTTVETAPGQVSVESNGPLAAVFSLATLVPGLAAGWRRMHDTGRSGLYLLYPLIVMLGVSAYIGLVAGFEPVMAGGIGALFSGITGLILIAAMIVLMISPLLVLWWLTRPSQPGPNDYGPNPHEVTS